MALAVDCPKKTSMLTPSFTRSIVLFHSFIDAAEIKWSTLTLGVLNFSEGTITYIYILCHISTLIRHK